MVKEYYKKSFTPTTRKYRSPKIYTATRRKERPKLKLPPTLVRFALLLVIILAVFYYVFFSSKFRIKDIIVEGNSLVSRDEIVGVLPQNQNIFRLDIEQSKSLITTKFPEINEVEIYRGIPDALKIVVVERENKIVWRTNNELYYISNSGIATRKITTDGIKNLPVVVDTKNLPVQLGKPLVSPNFVAFITNVNATFQSEEGIKLLNFEIPETTFNINLKTDAGFFVKLNTLRSSQKQLSDLKAILAKFRPNIHEYVDLRIDGWAYYK